MISSELPEVLGMSDRVLVMREGRLVAELSRDEATQERVIQAAAGVAERPREVRRDALAAAVRRGCLPAARARHLRRARAITVAVLLGPGDELRDRHNWQDIATDVAMVVVVAVGETMVVLTRNIDLSVGSIVGLTAYFSSNTLAHHHGLPLVARRAARDRPIGLALRDRERPLVAVGRIPAIIATLATLAIYRGLLFEITHGQNVFALQLPEGSSTSPRRRRSACRSLAWIALVVALVGAAFLRWAPWARDFYAIGSNPDAARLAGIRVGRRVMPAFAISGALAGLGGFMFAARFATVDASRDAASSSTSSPLSSSAASTSSAAPVLSSGAVLGAVLVADDPKRLHAAADLRVLEDLLQRRGDRDRGHDRRADHAAASGDAAAAPSGRDPRRRTRRRRRECGRSSDLESWSRAGRSCSSC